MKKIILAFDGQHFSQGIYDFAIELNKKEPILATGVFLPIVDHTQLLYSLGTISGPLYAQEILEDDTEAIKANILKFRSYCKRDNIHYRVHNDSTINVVQTLQNESRYADLFLLSSEYFYKNLGEDSQEEYILKTVHKVECPTILSPEKCNLPQGVIFAYDGSEDSVFAIKQFAYLLPQYADLKAIIVYSSVHTRIPDLKLIKEYAECHFSNVTFFKLDAEPRIYFNTWLTENKNPILVAGAFGRSNLSEMVRKSFIMETIREHRIPIFISHR